MHLLRDVYIRPNGIVQLHRCDLTPEPGLGNALFPHRTVVENVATVPRLLGSYNFV